MDVVVGVVGRAHGIRGEVSVELRTDEPDRRFAPGAVLRPHPSGRDRLTVRSVRAHGERLLVGFDEVAERTDAESLRGASLLADVDRGAVPSNPEEFYDHQLVGLAVRTTGGRPVGTVTEVRHQPAQDLLVIGDRHGAERLVPFVAALVPGVDLDAHTLTVDPLPGLLDDAQAEDPASGGGPDTRAGST